MKQIRLLMMFTVMMFISWTASSQITGISKDQKYEVVSTLIAYPLVLNELSLTNQLLTNCNELNKLYKLQIKTYEDNEVLHKAQIKILKKQNKLFNTQLKKEKLNKFKIAGVGILAIAGAILIK
ncbi:MAG: hypothetical protein GY739_11300 [Mesoflavibacter sp.]|nr:hypothetical protein [Mesoflavibacter sp.]